MNVRTSLPLALLVALGATAPATIHGAQDGSAYLPAGSASATDASAAEAARLAAVAADMAQRAAQLAAASQQLSQTSPAGYTQIASGAVPVTREASSIQPYPLTGDTASTSKWRRRSQQESLATRDAELRSTSIQSNPGNVVQALPASPPEPSTEQASPTGPFAWRQLLGGQEEQPVQTPPQSVSAAANAAPQAESASDAVTQPGKFADNSDVEFATGAPGSGGVVQVSDVQYPESLPATSEYCDPASYSGDGCASGCCPPRRPLFWVVGAEATFLNPDLDGGSTSFGVEDFDDEETVLSAYGNDVDSFYVSPRVWLGIQGCKWGTNLRYWHMQAAEADYDLFINGNDDWGVPDAGFFSHGRLEAYTVDLEITRRFCVNCNCWLQLAAGIRHAEIEQDQSVTGLAAFDDVGDSGETDAVLFGYGQSHSLSRGTGIVLGLYGRQPLFPCSCVHLFYNLRGSAVWGPTETNSETFASVEVTSTDPSAVANAGSVNGAATAVDEDMFVGELQLGLEWDYCLRCLPAEGFVRFAVEYQRWDGGSGYTLAHSEAGFDVDGDEGARADADAWAVGPQLDLVGITLGTGLTW